MQYWRRESRLRYAVSRLRHQKLGRLRDLNREALNLSHQPRNPRGFRRLGSNLQNACGLALHPIAGSLAPAHLQACGHAAANARTIGTRQADAVQNITGSFSAGTSASEQGVMGTLVGAFGGISNKPAIGNATSSGANARATEVTFDASRVARTSVETRGANTALHPLIAL